MSAVRNIPPPKKYCSCMGKCGGVYQVVSHYKYKQHAPYRKAEAVLPTGTHRDLAVHADIAPQERRGNVIRTNELGTRRLMARNQINPEVLSTPLLPTQTCIQEEDIGDMLEPERHGEEEAPFSNSILEEGSTLFSPEYIDCLGINVSSKIPDLQRSLDTRLALQNASLDNGDLTPSQLARLRNPVPRIELDDMDNDVILSLKLFLSTTSASDLVYENVRRDIQDDDKARELLSHKSVKKEIAQLTGVEPIINAMCPNSCMAYTGTYKDLDQCSHCGISRLDPTTHEPRQRFYTMPIGPQLQARWSHPDTANLMEHRKRETEKIMEHLRSPQSNGRVDKYEDVYHGSDYLQAVHRGDIKPGDMTLMFSIDGAQLYQDKKSDCWIYIWVLLDLPPDIRYKQRHVIPGAIIPGPENPKDMESFMFPGFHHLAGIQKEGLRLYHGGLQEVFTSNPYLLIGSADGPGSTNFTGFVGHHGHHLCRLYCGLKGRHKPGKSAYYAALLKPQKYRHASGGHPDCKASTVRDPDPDEYQKNLHKLIQSNNKTNYNLNRKETGLSGLSIFSGLPSNRRLAVPKGFAGDCMHVANLNLGDLLIPLWRGSFHHDPTDKLSSWKWAVLTGEIWIQHGAAVASCRQYLPGSYDRPPRNLAEKVSSGYKAKEWQNYFYGLAPALLYQILPTIFWQNYCKLVYAMRLLHQKTVPHKHIQEAHKYMSQFHEEFEILYVQRRLDRIHMMRPCLHALLHMASETARLGPITLTSTWTMERAIGYLGSQIKQPSNPYHNLSERGLRQCQVNSLLVEYPEFDRVNSELPQYSEAIGDGYVFLRARERTARMHTGAVGDVLRQYFVDEETAAGSVVPDSWLGPKLLRWARLQLPNGQVARSAWKEALKAPEKVRRARIVKLLLKGQIEFAEVQFYFFGRIIEEIRPLALVLLLSRPDEDLFKDSCFTVWSVTPLLPAVGLRVVPAKSILSSVAAIPHTINRGKRNEEERLFIWEQFGMEVALWSEALSNPSDEADELGDGE